MSTDNHRPSENGERDIADEVLGEARSLYRRPSPQLQEQTWMRMKEEIDLRRSLSGRRYRVGRVALVASILMIVGGLGGYAAGRVGLTLNVPDTGRGDGPIPDPNGLADGAHTSRTHPNRPMPPDKPQDETGRAPGRNEVPPSPVAQKTGTTSPLPNLAMQGHPVVGTSFSLEDGDHVLPLLPKNPLRPFAHLDWFYPVPAHVTDCKFNPARRALKFKLRLTASRAAVDRARREIAHAYNAKGQVNIKPEDINIQPLQRVGYRLALDTGRGDLELKARQGPTTTARMPVTAEIPPNYKALIENLATDPDYVSLVATGLYAFEYSTSASTEAQGLRSASLKALEEINGGMPLTGPIIVDRRGRQEYLQRMRNEVVVWARGYGMEAQPMTELALKQLGTLEPMSFREFLDQPGQLMIWNTEMGRLELQPGKYDFLTRETRKLLEEQDQIKSLSKSISYLATHELDEGKFYSRLQEALELHTKAKGGIPVVFSADLAVDLKKTYDNLSGGEKKAVSDYKRSASNENAFESQHIKKSDEMFRGNHHLAGTNPKGWDLYRISDEAIVGETLFGSHQVKILDVQTVAISEEFPIEVEKADVEIAADGPLASAPVNNESVLLRKELDSERSRISDLEGDIKGLKEIAKTLQHAQQRIVTGEWRFHWDDPSSGIVRDGQSHLSRQDSKTIRFYFPRTFDEAPEVHTCISMLAASHPEIEAQVSNVTKEHFDLKVVWHGGHVPGRHPDGAWWDLWLTWIALPKDKVDHAKHEVLP